jgi:acetylornithine aminotransferase
VEAAVSAVPPGARPGAGAAAPAGSGTGADGGALGRAPTASAAVWTARYGEALMGTFGTPQRVLVRGEGPWVWDVAGTRYLDLLAGIAVNAPGHAHPTLVSAVSAQLGTLGHVSNFFATPTQITLAERLL